MDDHLIRSYRRWQDAETSGHDDDADAAFANVFRSVAEERDVSPRFTAETMETVAAAAARDAVRARRVRTMVVPAIVVAALVAVYFGAGLIVSAFSATVVWLVNLMIGTIVWVANGMQSGPEGGSIMTSLGRAAAAVIANPAVTITILAIQACAMTALFVLQRLLGSDRESFR